MKLSEIVTSLLNMQVDNLRAFERYEQRIQDLERRLDEGRVGQRRAPAQTGGGGR